MFFRSKIVKNYHFLTYIRTSMSMHEILGISLYNSKYIAEKRLACQLGFFCFSIRKSNDASHM